MRTLTMFLVICTLEACALAHEPAPDPQCFEDVVYVLDISGSMLEEWDPVVRATAQHARAASSTTRFALVVVGLDPATGSPGYGTSTDFTDLETFLARLFYFEVFGTWPEPTFDAVHALGTGTLPLSYRAGSTRRVIVLSNEHEGDRVTGEMACESLTHGERLTVLTRLDALGDFPCGTALEMIPDQAFMLRALRSTDVCQ